MDFLRRLPRTMFRVPKHTDEKVNRNLRRESEERVSLYADHPAGIDERLRALDREWDIERMLEANAAALGLAGVILGIYADRRFLALPAVVTGFLLQHALQGWCPPLPLFRRAGFRTSREILEERMALKMLRGDFSSSVRRRRTSGREAMEAVRE